MITINGDKAKAIQNQKTKEARAAAFAAELDPLTMKAMRGEATKAQLAAKAAEIRERLPYQE